MSDNRAEEELYIHQKEREFERSRSSSDISIGGKIGMYVFLLSLPLLFVYTFVTKLYAAIQLEVANVIGVERDVVIFYEIAIIIVMLIVFILLLPVIDRIRNRKAQHGGFSSSMQGQINLIRCYVLGEDKYHEIVNQINESSNNNNFDDAFRDIAHEKGFSDKIQGIDEHKDFVSLLEEAKCNVIQKKSIHWREILTDDRNIFCIIIPLGYLLIADDVSIISFLLVAIGVAALSYFWKTCLIIGGLYFFFIR